MAAIAINDSHLLLGRFIPGIGIGISSVVGPMYLGEIATARHRGAIVSVYQLGIAVGILGAYVVSFDVAPDWRGMFAWGILPAALQFLFLPFMIESPQWLIGKGYSEKAYKTSELIGVNIEIAPSPLIEQKGWKTLVAPGVGFALFIGLALSCLQQITGINAVIYFAPQIFELVGLPSAESGLFATLGIGIVTIIATAIATWLLDKVGRKALLLIGIAGMGASLLVMAFGFFFNYISYDNLAAIALMAYAGSFAISFGPVTWVILSEIFPLSIRGRAIGIALLVNWLANYLVSLTFLDFVQWIGIGGTFALFAAICIFAFFFVLRLLPETKGKSYEEIQRLFNPQS